MQVVDGRLETTDEHAADLQYAAYLLDGRIYPEGGRFNRESDQRFQRRRVDHRFAAPAPAPEPDPAPEFYRPRVDHRFESRDGELRFDGRTIQLPRGARLRIFWQAIEWRGWILALVRTSETDGTAEMVPPFFATELLAFPVNGSDASLRYIDFNPPPDVGFLILNPQP